MRAIRHSFLLSTLLLSAVNAAPAAAAAPCALTVLTTIQLRPSSYMPMIDAMIDDKPVALLVDTGGGMSSLTKVAVRELNLQTGQYVSSDGTILTLKDVTGQTEALQVRLPSIMLGRIRQEGVYFMVLPGDDNATTPRVKDFGGILGTDVLKNVDVELDFGARTMNLIAPNQCGGHVVHWSAPAVAVVPITLDRFGQLTFRMELDGRRVTAMLDTGASTTVLNLDTARRTFRIDVNAPDVEKVGELTGGYSANTYRRRFKSISFEGVTVSNPMITMMPNMMGNVNPGSPRTGSLIRDERNGLPDVILGMNVLSEMHLYIAYKDRRLHLTAASPQPASASAAAPQ
jgi:predicted aspartyl protease